MKQKRNSSSNSRRNIYDVILEGEFKNVVVQSPNITVYAQNTEIENVEINGTRSKVIVDDKSEIEKVVVNATNIVIEGKGTVSEVEVKQVEVEQK